ncbi:Rho-binding antiterminator [Vibrio sp.]|nr:Rho-binding antiterminator [Vibrio sp.]
MLTCSQYDHIEIVCMFQYPVRLVLKDGSVLEGIAIDTVKNQMKDECLQLLQNQQENVIPLEMIKMLIVSINNPHFTSVSFDN